MTRPIALLALFLLATVTQASELKLEARPNDFVWVKDSETPFEGTIKEEKDGQIRFVMPNGIVYTWSTDQVVRVQRKCTLEQAYEQATKAAGNDAREHLRLYEACLAAKLDHHAVPELRKAIQADPKFVTAYDKLIEVARAAGNTDLELGTLDAASRAGITTIPMLRRQTQIYIRLRLKDSAEQPLRRILTIDPQDGWAESGLALLDIERGQLDRAEKVIQAMLRRNAKDPYALVALGQLEFARGRMDKAAAAFTKAAEQSKSALAAACLGAIELRQGKLAEAAKHYELARALRPDLLQAMAGHALIAARRGEPNIAAQLIQKVSTALPQDLTVCLARAYVSELAWDNPKALEAYEAALALDGANLDALCGAGRSVWRLGDRTKAAEYFQRALSIQSGFPPALRGLGGILLDQKPAESAERFRQLIDSGSGMPEDHAALACALVRLQRFGEAADEFGKTGDNVNAHIGLGYLNYSRGKIDNALTEFEAAVKLGDSRNYAADAIKRIRVAESRVVWTDNFERERPDDPEVRNGWQEHEPPGVAIAIRKNALEFDGLPTSDDRLVRISRPETASFISVTAEAANGAESASFVGVCLEVRGKSGPVTLLFGRNGKGQAAKQIGQSEIKELSRKIPPGPFTLGIEIVNAAKGVLRLLVDGRRIPGESDIQLPELAGTASLEVGLFALPPKGQKVNCQFRNVKIVRSK